MKSFSTYQHLKGEPMTDRDRIEVGSKYWNEGKWDNLVLPFLPNECEAMTFVDMGCNAGLFLKLAEDHGFGKALGVDSDKEAIERGKRWRDTNEGKYKLILSDMKEGLDELPVCDYMVFANSHYYFDESTWLEIVEKLSKKVGHCIIISAKKKPNPKYAASDIDGIRGYFQEWKETGLIDLPSDNTPHSRHLWSLCFKNPKLERVPIDCLDNGNAQQRNFLEEFDKTNDPFKTMYYKRLQSYRRKKTSKQRMWREEELNEYMKNRIELYKDVKKHGLKSPIVVNSKNARITDGNHRHEIMRHIGEKSIIIKIE